MSSILTEGSGGKMEKKLPAWAAAWEGTYEEDMRCIEEMRKTNPNWGKLSHVPRQIPLAPECLDSERES